jgi:hypothetical protein
MRSRSKNSLASSKSGNGIHNHKKHSLNEKQTVDPLGLSQSAISRYVG